MGDVGGTSYYSLGCGWECGSWHDGDMIRDDEDEKKKRKKK